jgi:hypothetical protein
MVMVLLLQVQEIEDERSAGGGALLRAIMESCWVAAPTERPSFSQLAAKLQRGVIV